MTHTNTCAHAVKSGSLIKNSAKTLSRLLKYRVLFGKHVSNTPCGSINLFPVRDNILSCGLAGIISIKKSTEDTTLTDLASMEEIVSAMEETSFACLKELSEGFSISYLCGSGSQEDLYKRSANLKKTGPFTAIFMDRSIHQRVIGLASRLERLVESEESFFKENQGLMEVSDADSVTRAMELLKDSHWCLSREILSNTEKIRNLMELTQGKAACGNVEVYMRINSVLNSLDRLEVRGRDSSGISVLFNLDRKQHEAFTENLKESALTEQLKGRCAHGYLRNNSISVSETSSESATVTFTYKIAAEIGSLGDNIAFIRKQVGNDRILQILTGNGFQRFSVTAHTRWASVGAITEANCHPVDNRTTGPDSERCGQIHVCLNGDIDNHLKLKEAYENRWDAVQKEITSDTKIIPLQVERYIKDGADVAEAFRKAVCDFEGSHAISMQTDLAPGKIFLAQKGSGQAVFIGLAGDHYMPASEVYGFVEETSRFIKMDGEKTVQGKDGETQGQIFILDQDSFGGLSGITAFYYDGTPVQLTENDIKETEITTRDIDRQDFPHYFLKEISEAPGSVEKTLHNRWKIADPSRMLYETALGETVIPPALEKAFTGDEIRRIYFVGQGTAGVAALACANLLKYYLDDPKVNIRALKASELSGFELEGPETPDSMSDCLVVAISQSGTTTDTNLTVDMVRARGARTMAIVNRRDSDLTFKVEGVLYTSSGRDLEMSVASTKAFYSQIVAGALLGLEIARLSGRKASSFISEELKKLLALPGQMRKVLELKEQIGESARRLAVKKTYWAAVGSGPNKASADEIRIKLSELCYKTLSSDFVEDKKHIDLSSEPLIIVCAAGTRESVTGDIIKDTAIFHAHKAVPVVITDEGEDRFDPYAADVFKVPAIQEHLAPILNTLAGHIWGYYAALSINDSSRFFYEHREDIRETVEDFSRKGQDSYEVILEKSFREKIADFYRAFRKKQITGDLPEGISTRTGSDLLVLLKYLSGRLPVSDFEFDFGTKGTPSNMLETLFTCLNEAVNQLSRPVDAIKHQAKTVTVGTSRVSEQFEGIVFDAMAGENFNVSQLTNQNVLVLRHLQEVISGIRGYVLYRIDGLNLLGEITEDTSISIVKKEGLLVNTPSRVEQDNALKGTKHIIVREGNVFIGKGLKDGRSILVIPLLTATENGTARIGYLLSLNVAFKEETDITLYKRIKALGGKYTRIKDIVQENSFKWNDSHLEKIKLENLFGDSAEITGNRIIEMISRN